MPGLAIVAPIVLPLAVGVAAVVARRQARWLAIAVALLQLPLAWWLASSVSAEGPLRYQLGGWSEPLGINLYADGLAALMVGMTAVVGLGVAGYATQYFTGAEREHPQRQWYWPLSLLLGGSLNALFLSGDIFNLYVTLELLTLSAVALVGLGDSVDALAAALRYLLIAVVASLFYLLGVALLYTLYGTLDWQRLGTLFEFDFASRCAIMLIVTGLLVKTALFPLHFWLPAAHASAPAPASALLSGLVLKASFFVLLRFWFAVFPGDRMAAGGELLGWLGAAAILWGSMQAIRQRRLKLLIAYSTVAQIGYLFLVFSLATDSAVGAAGPFLGWNAWSGTVFFALSHACAKAAAFLAAGSLQIAAGGGEIDDLTGSAADQPVTVYAFALAGVSLMGLPPSGGFVAKWLLLNAALQSHRWGLAIVILAGGLMAAVYVFRVLARACTTAEPVPRRRIPLLMQWTPMFLALVSIGLGMGALQPLNLLRIGAPFSPPSDPRPTTLTPPLSDFQEDEPHDGERSAVDNGQWLGAGNDG